MQRSPKQCQRLAFDAQLLARYARSFRFVSTTPQDTRLEGELRAEPGRTYGASIEIPFAYPCDRPRLYITKPSPLLMQDGRTPLSRLGISHAYHVLGLTANGHLQLCHFTIWSASNTVIEVIMRLALWIRAYGEHLRTGRTIDAIIRGWVPKWR